MTQSKAQPLISNIGSLSVGDAPFRCLTVTWPFGYIAVYSDFLLLRFQYVPAFMFRYAEFNARLMGHQWTQFPQEIRLAYSDIVRVTLRTFVTYAIDIEHKNALYPPYIECVVYEKKIYNLINDLRQQHKVTGQTANGTDGH